MVSSTPVLVDRNSQRGIHVQVFQKGESFLDKVTVAVLSVLAA